MREKIEREYNGCKVVMTFAEEEDPKLMENVLGILLESFFERIKREDENQEMRKAS